MKTSSCGTAHSHPPLRKRTSLGSSTTRHKQPTGVQFLSPSKSSHRHGTPVETYNSGVNLEETGTSKERRRVEEGSVSRKKRPGRERNNRGQVLSVREPQATTAGGKDAVSARASCADGSKAVENGSEGQTQLEESHVHQVVSQLRLSNPTSCAVTASDDGLVRTGSCAHLGSDHVHGDCVTDDPVPQVAVENSSVLASSVRQRTPSLLDCTKLFGCRQGGVNAAGRKTPTRKLPSTVLQSDKHSEPSRLQQLGLRGSEQPSIADFFAKEKHSCQRLGTSEVDSHNCTLISELQKHDLTSPAVQQILKAALEHGSKSSLPNEGSVTSSVFTAGPHNDTKVKAVGDGAHMTVDKQVHVAQTAKATPAVGNPSSQGKGKEKVGAPVKRSGGSSDCDSPNPKKVCRDLAGSPRAAETDYHCPSKCKPLLPLRDMQLHVVEHRDCRGVSSARSDPSLAAPDTVCSCHDASDSVCLFGLEGFFPGVGPAPSHQSGQEGTGQACGCCCSDDSLCLFGLDELFNRQRHDSLS